MDKRELRQDLFARLRTLDLEERAGRSSAIREFLRDDPDFRSARVVFSYLPLPTEPDLAPLLAETSGKTWAFPRVTIEDRLAFHLMDRTSDGNRGGHGIHEPDPLRHDEIAAGKADLILIPGVGFDSTTLARLGRGKGHYDRFLAEALASPKPPRLVGVAFSLQLADVATESHDVPMDRILTDQGWI